MSKEMLDSRETSNHPSSANGTTGAVWTHKAGEPGSSGSISRCGEVVVIRVEWLSREGKPAIRTLLAKATSW